MAYDVVIIGAGPGGYVAAIRAAQLGFKTACIEKGSTLGGTCLNVGCIPSKALLQSTEHYAFMKNHAAEHGIHCNDLSLDFSQMMTRKEGVVKTLTDGIAGLFQRNKIDHIHGEATFLSPTELKVGEQTIQSRYFVLATGSESTQLPFLPFDEEKIISSTGALALTSAPEKLVVIGGGVIGVELASVYSRIGSEVTVIEMLDTICAGTDKAITKALLQALKKQGIQFHLGAKVEKGVPTEKGITIHYNEGEQIEADKVLVAVGRRPYSKNLGLEALEITPNKQGFIPVDPTFKTSAPNVFAIGDLIEGPMLAHRASEEGVAVIEFLAGQKPHLNYMAIPNVVYTNPEIATVGLSEEEAKEMDVMTGQAFFRGNARARCTGETDGLVKIVGEKTTGRLLGVHIVGPHASEMIGEAVVAIEGKMQVKDLAIAPHAHPTLSEAIKEAAQATLGFAIHG